MHTTSPKWQLVSINRQTIQLNITTSIFLAKAPRLTQQNCENQDFFQQAFNTLKINLIARLRGDSQRK